MQEFLKMFLMDPDNFMFARLQIYMNQLQYNIYYLPFYKEINTKTIVFIHKFIKLSEL